MFIANPKNRFGAEIKEVGRTKKTGILYREFESTNKKEESNYGKTCNKADGTSRWILY